MIATVTAPDSETSTDAQDAEVVEGQHRHLGVGHAPRRGQGALADARDVVEVEVAVVMRHGHH